MSGPLAAMIRRLLDVVVAAAALLLSAPLMRARRARDPARVARATRSTASGASARTARPFDDAQAAHDGRRRRAHRRRAGRRRGRRPHHARRRVAAPHLARRAAQPASTCCAARCRSSARARRVPVAGRPVHRRASAGAWRVKPGITGWAQVNGRASLPWSERIELDLWYVEHRSLALDLQILARTARMLVLRGDGLYKGETGGWDGGTQERHERVLLTGVGKRYDIVSASRSTRPSSRPTPTRSRRRSTPRTRAPRVPRIDDPGYVPGAARALRAARRRRGASR